MKLRELALVAMLSVISVLGRILFINFPQIKPTAALVFLSAYSLGPKAGFLVGLLSMFLSNFVFGQGLHTLWQMLGMGAVGLAGAAIAQLKLKNKYLLTLSCGLATFLIYGFIVDSGTVIYLLAFSEQVKIWPIYLAGLPFNLAHGLSSCVFFLFLRPFFLPQLARICQKYSLFKQGMLE